MDFVVEFDKQAGQITVADIKSRMSPGEARALAAALVLVADEHAPLEA